MLIVGISAFYHDSAVAVVRDGDIVAAAQEERFSRIKHDPSFPRNALEWCLTEAKASALDIDHVAFYDKPFLKFERLLDTYVAMAPRGFGSFRLAMPVWLKEKLFLKTLLTKELNSLGNGVDWESRLLFAEHHLSHAASAFFPSPFQEAAVLTLDGVGEWATSSLAIGTGNKLEVQEEIHFPHSLGLLYSAFTYYAGFKVNSGEYKLMGLAPYGVPRFAATIRDHLIDIKADGSFRLNLEYFDYCTGLRMTNERFSGLFGQPVRKPAEEITQHQMDIAASVQSVTEEVMLRLARSTASKTGMENLCLAGGVALNCVANGKVLRDGSFRSIWVQPAAGDAGGALGAALYAYHGFCKGERRPVAGGDRMKGSYLGPAFDQSEIEHRLTAAGARFRVLQAAEVASACAVELAAGRALGWFQGRMEFGPRALGCRSILADARVPDMQAKLNLKVKYRESFRPFAPAILREDVADWFDMACDSPYMLFVAEVKPERRREVTEAQERLFGIAKLNVPRSDIPAATHVDYSARVQTVHRESNPLFHKLILEFKRLTGCPVVLNTSFNVRGEPIVCTPEEAFRCFMETDIDVLAIGNCLLRKEEQDMNLRTGYAATVEPD